MKMYDVTLLTAEEYLHPKDPNWYVRQILAEDELVTEALKRKGLRVHRIDWTNREFDWASTGAVVFRAAWDYTNRYEEFVRFVKSVPLQTLMINPPETVLWNLDKHYLRDLEKRGIRIPQTIYIEKNETVTLDELHRRYGFTETILKPTMSAGARHTYRLNSENISVHETILRELIAKESMILQPFLTSVTVSGEITLVVIGGKYSHAVMKRAKSGDFRVQDDFGGTVENYEPTAEEISFAEKAVSVCTPVPMYGRVDILRDNDQQMVVSELELIEPELWFRFHIPAAESFADAIAQRIASHGQ